jgi:hypothetical protein
VWSRRTICKLLAASSLRAAPPAGWQKVYEIRGRASIVDLSASEEGLAAAVGRLRGIASIWVSTGKEWTATKLPGTAVSVQCLGESTVWLVAENGIWQSQDRGLNWKLRHEATGLARVYFLNEARGFACGDTKRILETFDGGATWSNVPAAGEPTTNPAHTVYHWIHFLSPRVGIIAGSSRPPRTGRTSDLPAWRDPDRDKRRKEWPAASLTLETRDGGGTWRHSSTSLFGRITRVRYSKDGRGLALVEFHDEFEWPSELFSIDLSNGKSERVFRRENRAVTDFLLLPEGKALIAAVAPPDDPPKSTLGRVHLLSSSDLQTWEAVEIPELDAGRVWLAKGGTDLWAATDRGTILHSGAV